MLSHRLRASAGVLKYINSSFVLGSGTTVTGTVPSGAAAGDLLMAFSSQRSSTTSFTMTVPSGWTGTLDSLTRWCWYLPSWDGTTSTYNFIKSGSCNPTIVILAFRNANFDVQGALSAASGSPVAPEITLSAAGGIVCAAFSTANTSVTYTTPTGFTEVQDPGQAIAVSYKTSFPSGLTGTVTATASAGSNSRGCLVGIKQK